VNFDLGVQKNKGFVSGLWKKGVELFLHAKKPVEKKIPIYGKVAKINLSK
jgi:hypothetical protein